MSGGSNGVPVGAVTHTPDQMAEEIRKLYFDKAYRLYGPGTSTGIDKTKDEPYFVTVRQDSKILMQGWGKNWQEALDNLAKSLEEAKEKEKGKDQQSTK